MDNGKVLLSNLDKVHTTKMGVDRIKKNLRIDVDDDVSWCKDKISDTNSQIAGKENIWRYGKQAIKI